MKTYDEAKQQVAESHEFQSFWHLEQRYPKAISRFYAEAAELYARNLANEKVREDRESVLKQCVEEEWLKEANWDCSELYSIIDVDKMKSLPLPFPDEK